MNRTFRSFRSRLSIESLEDRSLPSTAYAIGSAMGSPNVLFRFDTATPNTVAGNVVTGLGANETLVGLDFRPRTGQLIGSTVTSLSADNSVVFTYAINPLTFQATLIGQTAAALAGAGDVDTGYDFNPTVDRIRFVNENNENARFNPNNAQLAGNDTDLTFAVPAVGPVIAEAYDRNFDRINGTTIATTLYGIDRGSSRLVIQGGLNSGGPGGPNAGVITSVGPLGITIDPIADGGLDIVPSATGTGRAFAVMTNMTDSLTGLYEIDLTTGAATFIDEVGTGATVLRALAIVPESELVAGAGPGNESQVRVIDANTGVLRQSFLAFGAGFGGGVRTASGDLTGDGILDYVVAAGPGGGPHVKVFNGVTNAVVGSPIGNFFAYDPSFRGGIHVAVGDVNGDGFDDLITAPDGGGGPHVRVFNGMTGTEIVGFFAYDPSFRGGVSVAAVDTDLDGDAEIITGSLTGTNGHVRVLEGTTGADIRSFFAYDSAFRGGAYVAAGILGAGGQAQIITGAGPGAGPHLKTFAASNGAVIQSFFPFASTYTGGVRVGVADTNRDGRLDILASGTNGAIMSFDAVTLQSLDTFNNLTGSGSSFVSGSRQ